MEKLYCPECGNYLEGGDGSMVDCHCGWKQERSLSSDEDEIEQLRQRVQELTAERDKAHQYWQIAEGRCDALMKQRDELVAAIENCRLLAARHRKEEWATHILRFCVESGVIGSPIRDTDIASVKEKS